VTSGNVGIGTASPRGPLEVFGTQTGTGTIAASGTSVTGNGTTFQSQLQVGDRIVVSGQTRTVSTITSNTVLTIDSAFAPAITTTNAFTFSRLALLIAATGNVGIGTASPRTALDTRKGVMSGAANDYQKAQFTMSGGGSVTWGGTRGRLKWTQRFIAISAERGSTFSNGFVDIVQPTTDIPKANVYDDVARSANADGIVLNGWEALYAAHTVGGNNTDVSFFIRAYTSEFFAPSNWLLVALVNGDDDTVKLGTGVIVSASSSFAYGSVVPSGAILMWKGATNAVPTGWALCDGKNGTPDLRDRFVVGAGTSYAVSNTGGAATVTLGIDHMPSHDHDGKTVASGAHGHTINGSDDGWAFGNTVRRGDSNQIKGPVSIPPAVDHTHTITKQGGGVAHENRPPYYALAYIMKL